MSTLIEQAMQRLERLRGAGVAAHSVTGGDRARASATKNTGTPAIEPSSQSRRQQPTRGSRRVELSADALARARLQAPGSGTGPQASQFRMMKRPLIKNITELRAAGHVRTNLIMVTSALAGEGKSFTAANLALSMASELDHTVLLVDADVARPSLARVMGFESDVGLLDVLESKVGMEEALLSTNIEKLSLLPSGSPRPGATELLASESMRLLLDEMAQRYPDRIIIFDSPPLLLTTEASVLATYMGQIVVVVRADSTPQAAVQRAVSAIASHPIKLVVMNHVHEKLMSGPGYGYGYTSYGYGVDT